MQKKGEFLWGAADHLRRLCDRGPRLVYHFAGWTAVEYIGISIETLKDLARDRSDLIVVDLRKPGFEAIGNSLRVPVEELNGFLRWVPQHSTLVLCGLKEVAFCPDDIEMTLVRLGLQFVFFVDDGTTTEPVAGCRPLSIYN